MGIEIHDGIELWRVRLFDPGIALREGAYHGLTGTNAYSIGANLLWGQFWPLSRGATADRIAVSVQTAEAGKVMRLGIYADDDLDGYPDRLVLDAGEADISATGTSALVIDQHLPGGLYFLAMLSDGANAKLWMEDVPRFPSPLGTIGGAPGLPTFAWRVAQAYGALPDPFPSGATEMNDVWSIALRLAERD
jgi:hypothetical protein